MMLRLFCSAQLTRLNVSVTRQVRAASSFASLNRSGFFNSRLMNQRAALCPSLLSRSICLPKLLPVSSQIRNFSAEHNGYIYYQEACIAFRNGDEKTACGLFKRAYEFDNNPTFKKNYLIVLHRLVKIDIETNCFEEAHEKLDRLSSHDEYKEYALYEKGRLYFKQNKFGEADAVLSNLIQYNPELGEAKRLHFLVLKTLNWSSYGMRTQEDLTMSSKLTTDPG